MSEPVRRSALDGHYQPGRFGVLSEDGPHVVLAECRPRSIAQVNGAPDSDALAEALGATASDVSPNRAFHAGAARYGEVRVERGSSRAPSSSRAN